MNWKGQRNWVDGSILCLDLVAYMVDTYVNLLNYTLRIGVLYCVRLMSQFFFLILQKKNLSQVTSLLCLNLHLTPKRKLKSFLFTMPYMIFSSCFTLTHILPEYFSNTPGILPSQGRCSCLESSLHSCYLAHHIFYILLIICLVYLIVSFIRAEDFCHLYLLL